jgi:surface antigen
MSTFDDSTLIAHVHGELDPETSAEIEAACEADPALSQAVAELRESGALARAAFNHVMYEPMPDIDVAGPVARGGGQRRWVGALLAASLTALVLGGVGGHLATKVSMESAYAHLDNLRQADLSQAAGALQRALEKSASGATVAWHNPDTGSRVEVTPVRTFRVKSGQYCRQFDRVAFLDGVASADQGIACRDDEGNWRTRVRYFEG